jgi:hypothetical protein
MLFFGYHHELIAWKIKYYDGSRRKGPSYVHTIKRWKANWIGYILGKDYLLKHVTEGKIGGLENEQEERSSYWMNLRKREAIGTWKKKK